MEQTFKVSEFDITSEDDIKKILNEEFINKAMSRFQDMYDSLKASMEILWIYFIQNPKSKIGEICDFEAWILNWLSP